MRTALQAIGLMLVLSGMAAADSAPQPSPDPHVVLGEVERVVSSHGIDEAKAINIGGIRQWITVRGRDRRNPILLLLHGGPAAPDLPNRYLFEGAWADFFTIVEWDQRGSGKTYALNDPDAVAPTMHRAQMIQDTEELITYLRRTYSKDKIFVMGHSWGTTLGLAVAERHPEWLYAYIGAGQIINMQEGERAGYQFALGAARAAGDTQAVEALTAIAPYPGPHGEIPLDKINVERQWSVHFGGLTYGRSSYDVWADAEEISPDYSAADVHAIGAGSRFSLPRLLPEMADVNFDGLTRLRCPVSIFAGRHDFTTPNAPVIAWFNRLKAPSKRFVWFENSAHMMYEEEPGRALLHLVQDARPIAAAAGDVAPETEAPRLDRKELVSLK
jgi:pimeloyl-ACP methyl ester carboxylesterase